MKAFCLIAIILVILCFWHILPVLAILLAIGFGIAVGGILLAIVLQAGWNRLTGKS